MAKNSPNTGAAPTKRGAKTSSSSKTDELVLKAKSQQVLRDFARGKSNFEPDFNPRTALNIVRNDPVISAAIDSIVSKCMEGGWGAEFGNKDREEQNISFLKRDLRFDRILRSMVRTGRWQDILIEIVKEDNKVIALNLLDPAEVQVNAKPNGDVNFWFQDYTVADDGTQHQIMRDGQNFQRIWQPNQVVHIKFKDAILNLWGESDLRVAWDTIRIKDGVRKILNWLFNSNQFRNHINFEKASDQEIIDFISSAKEGELTFDRPMITQGGVNVNPLREPKDLDMFLLILRWCDEQLISLMRTTVVNLGLGGSGGRSESDGLGDIMRSNIKNIQDVISEAINYELFPKMDFPKTTKFFWKPLDRMSKQKLFESVNIMRQAGFSDEAVVEFMTSEGLQFKAKKLFEANENLKADKDLMPSRSSTKEGEADKNVGTGEDSSTREDQITSKASEDASSTWNKYPYVMGGDE